ncbi:MAG: hypothetical protein AB7V77_00825 [Candidatus Woesearchaeota archaeon]
MIGTFNEKTWYKFNVNGFSFYVQEEKIGDVNKYCNILSGERNSIEKCIPREYLKLDDICTEADENLVMKTQETDGIFLHVGNSTEIKRIIEYSKEGIRVNISLNFKKVVPYKEKIF